MLDNNKNNCYYIVFGINPVKTLRNVAWRWRFIVDERSENKMKRKKLQKKKNERSNCSLMMVVRII